MAQVGADCSPHSLDQDSGGPRGAASFVGRESLTEEAQSLHPGARAGGRPSRALCARGTGGPQPRQPPSGTADPRKPEGRESRRQRTVSRHHTATGVMLGEPAARAQQRRWEQPRPPPPPRTVVPRPPAPGAQGSVPCPRCRQEAPAHPGPVSRPCTAERLRGPLGPGTSICSQPGQVPAFPSEAPPPRGQP